MTGAARAEAAQTEPAATSPRLVQGNEACAEGALAAGCRFYAGYPITPSSEIAEAMARMLPLEGGVFLQVEDEIAAIAAVIGASLGGVKAITATSGPGFSLMQENIGFAAMAEVPSVVVNVMRGGPSTGQPTAPAQADVMQARWGTHGDHPAIALAPSSILEAFNETVRAFNLAEKYRTPVIVLLDEVIAHMREVVRLPESVETWQRVKPDVAPEAYLPYAAPASGVPPMANFGDGYRHHVTGLSHDEHGFPSEDRAVAGELITRLMGKIELGREEILKAEEFCLEDAEIVIIAYGCVARAARAAVRNARERGQRVGLFRPITLWPFADERIREFAADGRTLITAEMNMGQIALEVERASGGNCPLLRLNRVDGDTITPGQILDKIAEARP
ncbi:MAG TPA: 2-oxoacid:acceptor oxidoreductase subunit alpha [Alphaproteobacteria bacterium]|nr:2-oxoacid:acceptor oxidoreductase subunit alpha [Alphaproteobacteria bacterium]